MDGVPPAAPSDDRPLVYACLGTSFNTRRLVFRTLIEGLADEPVDVLISTGNGTITVELCTGSGPMTMVMRISECAGQARA